MTGHEFDEDEPETFRPAPHPDDRLWRHPSEIAAMAAAQAAETAKLPVVKIDGATAVDSNDGVEDASGRGRLQVAMAVAAGVVVIGAAALTIGVLTARGPSTGTDRGDDEVALIVQASNPSASGATGPIVEGDTQPVSATGSGDVSAELHDEVAASLPRIQAVTPSGMREGSGLFITDDGHIATSAGLIDDAEYVLAWTDDGQRWKANVVAADPISDVAVIHIESSAWPAASLGSGNVWDGQSALALDHFDDSIESGEIISVGAPVVEVDQPAALPGSALVDDSGAVIAMVTADGTNRHAIPAWMLEQVAVDLIATGSTVHVSLGVAVSDVPGDAVRVEWVAEGGPADDAGLQVGDLVDSLDGEPVMSPTGLHRLVQSGEPGDEVVLTVTRESGRQIVITTVVERSP